jgi:hypothetical protein
MRRYLLIAPQHPFASSEALFERYQQLWQW